MSYRIFHLFWLSLLLLPAFSAVAQTPTPTPTPHSTASYVAYLSDGNLWAVRSDGSDRRLIAIAPPGEVIQDFVWSADGQRIYFAVGTRFFDASLTTGNLASGGSLNLPSTVALDRLELGRDGSTIIVHTLDEEGLPRVFGMPVGGREAHELSVDEYNALTPQPAPIVRRVGEMSVAPDARFVLFKEAVGTSEELFVAEIETGRRWQITNLAGLEGFEETAEALGGRFIIEATWSPDGRYVLFNPGQSCSESGLCYGKLYLVEMWGGAHLQLSLDMMISLPLEWDAQQTLLAYDDENEIVLSDKGGQTRRLATGNRPKWQPAFAPVIPAV